MSVGASNLIMTSTPGLKVASRTWGGARTAHSVGASVGEGVGAGVGAGVTRGLQRPPSSKPCSTPHAVKLHAAFLKTSTRSISRHQPRFWL